MSKLREEVRIVTGDLETPEEADLRPFVVFTQLKAGGAYLYAGWLDAADEAMALRFAREHYGQDQECTNIWVIGREHITGTDLETTAGGESGARRTFQVFKQDAAGDPFESAGAVEASGGDEALEAARTGVPGAREWRNLWVVPTDAITATDEDDLIWRYTDQSYRLARGYSKEVREKWERVRRRKDLEEYERDDLKESF